MTAPSDIWVRAWRNQFVSERTATYQSRDGSNYELARCRAEDDANTFDDTFAKATDTQQPQQADGGRVLAHRLHQPNHSSNWIDGDYTEQDDSKWGLGWSVERAYAPQPGARVPDARLPNDGNGDEDAHNAGFNECRELWIASLGQQPAQVRPEAQTVGKKLYELQIRGKNKSWNFESYVDPQYAEEWTADGLVIDEVCNVIPEWIADMRLTRAWCFLQDVFNFTNPFKGYGGRDDG